MIPNCNVVWLLVPVVLDALKSAFQRARGGGRYVVLACCGDGSRIALAE